MRDGWREALLDELLQKSTASVTVRDIETVPYAGVRLHGRGVYRRDAVDAVTVKAEKLTPVRRGQVVYNRMWATRGSFGVAGGDVDGCLVTNDFPVFDVVGAALPDYLALILASPLFHVRAAGSAVGTTERKRLLERDFLALPVELPPLAEQRRIVDLIARADEAVSAARRDTTALIESRRLVILNVVALNGSHSVPIGDVLAHVIGGAWGDPPGTEEADVDALNLLVFNNPVLTVNPRYSSRRSLSRSRLASRSIHTDDIILERSGGTDDQPVGRVVYADRPLPDVVPTDFMRLLRVDKALIEPRFVYWWLWARYQRGDTRAFQSKTTNIRNLSVPSYLDLPISVMPRADQRLVINLGEAFTEATGAADRVAASLSTLRSALLSDLLSGSHPVPASYDRLLDGAA